MENVKLDCKGDWCPVPIVKLSKVIKTMESGQILEIEATDTAFIPDLKAWNNRMGHIIISIETGEITRVLLKKV